MKRKNKKKGGKFLLAFITLILLAGAGYVYTAPEFERKAPTIAVDEHIFWNRIDPLEIHVSDNVALKHYEVLLNDGKKNVMISQGDFEPNTKDKTVLLKYPKGKIFDKKSTKFKLTIIATDRSLWNFIQGNKSVKNIDVTVDYKRPNVNVLANSYSITQGGSALVVFHASDANLDKLYIEAAGYKYKAQPYKKKGYYAALIAWPFTEKNFSAKIIASDLANNIRKTEIPFYLINHKYRVSWIKATDKFIDGKITDLSTSDPEYASIDGKLEKLRAINETMRLKNEEKIHTLGKKISNDILKTWKVQKFYPLKNGARVASYGDERHYYYKNKSNEVSHSYHVGYDLASTKMASIRTSNAGTVVYANDNGIYGNMPMIDHGLGLYTLYGHCSQILVKEGDEVKAGEVIAKTGSTGLALGDHLHFGVLVQGVEVRPVEWFDAGWIRKSINNVFQEADKIILGK